jgi:deoxyadenosine/deoxycytidine kinase
MERVIKRARKSESTVSLEYLTKCHEKHEEWLDTVDRTQKIIFEADEEFIGTTKVKELAQRLMTTIL